ncbi:uncharacterized protein TNCV_1138251 [Trichonephila clavipes]|nr:uncharacterized protein TNCV_1138251 [Trichonephila clavipes]
MWNRRTNQQPGHCRCIRDAGVYRRGRRSNQQPGHCRCIRDAGVYRRKDMLHHGRVADFFGGGELYRSPGRLHTRTRLSSVPKTNRDSSLNTTFCQSVTFHIDLAWHHCRRSCRCSGVKGSARKRRLDLRFASARCLEIVCGTIATPTSSRIVERVTGRSTSACRTILRSSLLVVFLVAPDPVFRAWVPSRVHYSQQFLTALSERSTWPATQRVVQPAVFIPMIRPLSNSLNCEKCLLARLPGMFRLTKSSYNRRVIVTVMNLRICAGLYSTLFLIVAPPRRV